MKKNIAKLLYEHLKQPLLYTDEVQALTGYTAANIRTLVSRGHICLSYTPTPGRGRGVRAQYPMFDVVELMSHAELSRLCVYPTFSGGWKDGKPLAIGIANNAVDCLRLISGDKRLRERAIPGKQETEKISLGSEPYMVIYYDDLTDGIWAGWQKEGLAPIENMSSCARVVIDCSALAHKAIDVFSQYMDRV